MTLFCKADQLVDQVTQSREVLLGFGEIIVRHKPSADRWSIAEVIGHLVDSACNNHQRFIRAQQADSLAFPKYEQNFWVASNAYSSADWESLVELWYYYNLQLARVIRQIPAEKLSNLCRIGEFEPCSLEWLVTDYVDHLVHHLKKIEERVDGEA